MHIGTKIKELRKANNMTQEKLGELLGVKKAAIQKYEKGDIINLKIATIKKLCEIFRVEPKAFIFPDTEKFDIIHNSENIAIEVKLLEQIEIHYGPDTIKMIKYFTKLNVTGKARAIGVMEDLIRIDEYADGSR